MSLLAIGAVLTIGGMAQNTPAGQTGDTKSGGKMASGTALSGADRKFMMEAANGGMAEVQMGQLALQKATNDQVKQFAQKMVDDHGKANDELKALAAQKGVTLPTDVDAKIKAKMTRMQGLSGAAFDQAYVADMHKDHIKDVAAFQKEANTGKDSDVKGWAAKTLPTLQGHLDQIKGIHDGMGGKGNMKKTS